MESIGVKSNTVALVLDTVCIDIGICTLAHLEHFVKSPRISLNEIIGIFKLHIVKEFLIEEGNVHHVDNVGGDIGFGDITTDYLTNEDDTMKCELNSRVEGVLCGRSVFEMVFKTLSEKVKVTFYFKDGDEIKKGDKLAEIKGPARYVLMGERVASLRGAKTKDEREELAYMIDRQSELFDELTKLKMELN